VLQELAAAEAAGAMLLGNVALELGQAGGAFRVRGTRLHRRGWKRKAVGLISKTNQKIFSGASGGKIFVLAS